MERGGEKEVRPRARGARQAERGGKREKSSRGEGEKRKGSKGEKGKEGERKSGEERENRERDGRRGEKRKRSHREEEGPLGSDPRAEPAGQRRGRADEEPLSRETKRRKPRDSPDAGQDRSDPRSSDEIFRSSAGSTLPSWEDDVSAAERFPLWEFGSGDAHSSSKSFLVMRPIFGSDGKSICRDTRFGGAEFVLDKDGYINPLDEIDSKSDSPSPGRLTIVESGFDGAWRSSPGPSSSNALSERVSPVSGQAESGRAGGERKPEQSKGKTVSSVGEPEIQTAERNDSEDRGSEHELFSEWREFDSPPSEAGNSGGGKKSEKRKHVETNVQSQEPEPRRVGSDRRRVELVVRDDHPAGSRGGPESKSKRTWKHAAVSHRKLARLIKKTRIGFENWDRTAVITYPTGPEGFERDVDSYWAHRRDDRKRLNIKRNGSGWRPYYKKRTDFTTGRDLVSCNRISSPEVPPVAAGHLKYQLQSQPVDVERRHVGSFSREDSSRAGAASSEPGNGNGKRKRVRVRNRVRSRRADGCEPVVHTPNEPVRGPRTEQSEFDEVCWGLDQWDEFGR